MKLPKNQCKTCPFLPAGIELSPEKMAEIYSYLMGGTNHLCHSDRSNKTVCEGGRNWQLKVWHSRGWIAEPTNEALSEAMRNIGIEPKNHIYQ